MVLDFDGPARSPDRTFNGKLYADVGQHFVDDGDDDGVAIDADVALRRIEVGPAHERDVLVEQESPIGRIRLASASCNQEEADQWPAQSAIHCYWSLP